MTFPLYRPFPFFHDLPPTDRKSPISSTEANSKAGAKVTKMLLSGARCFPNLGLMPFLE